LGSAAEIMFLLPLERRGPMNNFCMAGGPGLEPV
jgi:hypothetical protein